jgi:hypothetical protein
MTSASTTTWRALAAAALLTLGAAGCFNPSIKEGGFACSKEFVHDCPDGFRCVNGLCWKGTPVDAPVDLAMEAKPDGMSSDKPEGGPIDKQPDVACLKPVSGCTPQAGMCDPLCQTGCGCQEKCSVNTAGALTCNQISGSLIRTEGQSCDQVSLGTTSQTDDCAPGLVCLDRGCNPQCSKLCRVDADCPGSTCSRDYATGWKVCDVQASECNPVTALGPPNCGLATAVACYLSATITDRVVCDCPFKDVGEGQPCTLSRDCLRGMACVDTTGTANFRCQRVCSLTGAMSGCRGEETCRPVNGSKKYGFCRI